MENILMSGCLAFFITFFAIPIIIQVAKDKKLFDEPDQRKVHKIVIPNLGGLGIFAGFMIATLLCVPSVNNDQLQYFIAAATVIFFLGLKDDILILSVTKKFLGQILAAIILIKLGGIQLSNLQGFLGIYQITDLAGSVLSLFAIIVITNSFNLIDGVDGLAGSLGILSTLCFGVYFFMNGDLTLAVMAFSLVFSLAGFLIYNFPPAKIFMGDTGSLLIGLVNSILFIKFINNSDAAAYQLNLYAVPAIAFSILSIPLFDTLRVFGSRVLNRRSPFSPDRNHIHHILLDLGLSQKQTTLICLSANIIFIGMAVILDNIGTTPLIGLLSLMAGLFTGSIYYLRSKRKIELFETISEKKINTSHKIFSLTPDAVEMD